MSMIVRVLLTCLSFLFSASSVLAQCQNQICTFDGSCYKCTNWSGYACSPHIGRCPQSCTETRCASPAEVQNVLNQPSTLPLASLQSRLHPSLMPMSDGCIEQMTDTKSTAIAQGSDRGISIVAEWQMNSPVNFVEWTVAQDKDKNLVVKRVVIENLGSAPVVGYQLGWMLIFADREPEIHVLEPVAVNKLTSKTVMEIGEPLPDYSADEGMAKSQEEAFANSPRNAFPPIKQDPNLKGINIFIASVTREGSPGFHENVSELTNQVKARFREAAAVAR
jgi:hypothetical protein